MHISQNLILFYAKLLNNWAFALIVYYDSFPHVWIILQSFKNHTRGIFAVNFCRCVPHMTLWIMSSLKLNQNVSFVLKFMRYLSTNPMFKHPIRSFQLVFLHWWSRGVIARSWSSITDKCDIDMCSGVWKHHQSVIVTCSHNCIISREKSPQQVQAMHLRDAINSAVTAAVWNTWHEHRRVCFYYLCCLCMISVAKQRLESDLSNINPPVIDSHNFKLEM